MRLSWSALLLLAMSSVAGSAELYKWRDAQGVHYSDQPPPPGAQQVERKGAKGGRADNDALPYETQQAAKKYPVTLYSFPECGEVCANAEAYLNKRGIPFTLKSREEDKAELVRLTGENQAPVLVVGRQPPLKGYSETQWGQLLDLAGYPKSDPLAGLHRKPAAVPKPATAPAPDRGE